MPSVTALYIHPVKSMTPESVAEIGLTDDARVIGDRVLGFRFRSAGDPDDWAWQTKQNFVGLVNTPGLVNLSVDFNPDTLLLKMHAADLLIAEGLIDDPHQRSSIESAFNEYVLTLDPNPLSGNPERQPPMLVGDGTQPLFQDTADGLLTLHSEESMMALATALGDEDFDQRRFRSNVVISGVSRPFEELTWPGKSVEIGDTRFEVVKAVKRCLVTHANPITGTRDRDVMGTLVAHFTPDEPQFAVRLRAVSGSMKLRQGDSLRLQD